MAHLAEKYLRSIMQLIMSKYLPTTEWFNLSSPEWNSGEMGLCLFNNPEKGFIVMKRIRYVDVQLLRSC
jgi:hypothetical protein